MMELKECTICGSEVDDQFLYGNFGIMPVAFCVWCQSSLQSYCDQMFEIREDLEEDCGCKNKKDE
jgi:hypothetical protein